MGRKREGKSRVIIMTENTQVKLFSEIFSIQSTADIVNSRTADNQIFLYKIFYYRVDIFMGQDCETGYLLLLLPSTIL